jgi:SAM-dependent methyltransferase
MRDRTKSWDVWRAVSHCLETVPLDGAVLDVGAWQSEVLWALGRVGFSALRGCDTDDRVTRMPGQSAIRYEVADFFALEDRPASLGALTCLSVIEHGMDAEGFFSRAAKLLAPGGRLLLTTDYWPTPIDTRGIVAFGRPWTVLSRSGAEGWLELAQSLGLEPDGLVSLEATDAPVTWSGRSYTFLWLAFRKRD